VTEEEIDIILEGGLNPIDRKNVHLSGSIEKAIEAGKVRTEVPLILRIDGKKAIEDGVQIFRAGKDVYITDRIDAKYISKAEDSVPAAGTTEEPAVIDSPTESTQADEEEAKPKPKPKRKATKKAKKTKEPE
jgi:hypothetical protein